MSLPAGTASRPAVSVVMPFAGDASAARAALQALHGLRTRAGDELILADNSGVASAEVGSAEVGSAEVSAGVASQGVGPATAPVATGTAGGAPAPGDVFVVHVPGERSPAHARNVGAEHAHNEWILFFDADCRAPRDLIDAFFSEAVGDDVGALAGEVVASPHATSLAGRYAAARNFLSQRIHVQHPYRPRAVAANLLVRRAAFAAVGGFYEGVRAAEDTDFSWRIQAAGWRLEPRSGACVEHHYRVSLRELRRQWRGYAAGRAWLARRYDGFVPEPALKRGAARTLGRVTGGDRSDPPSGRGSSRAGRDGPSPVGREGRLERGEYLLIDILLSAEELAGLVLSNRPGPPRGLDHPAPRPAGAARVVLVADRFPQRDDPLGQLARTLQGARVEAAGRPDLPDMELSRTLPIDYREDDGFAARAAAVCALALRHPVRSAVDVLRRGPGEPPLSALAPAVRRLQREPQARLQPLGGARTHVLARRIARLAGRRLDEPPPRTADGRPR